METVSYFWILFHYINYQANKKQLNNRVYQVRRLGKFYALLMGKINQTKFQSSVTWVKCLVIQWLGVFWDNPSKGLNFIFGTLLQRKGNSTQCVSLVLETTCSLSGTMTLIHIPSVTKGCRLWMGPEHERTEQQTKTAGQKLCLGGYLSQENTWF